LVYQIQQFKEKKNAEAMKVEVNSVCARAHAPTCQLGEGKLQQLPGLLQ